MTIDERWALILPHREHMLNVARRRCRTEEDAEDCVHEAMLRVAQFEELDPARAAAMLTSVTARLAVDMHRRRALARRYLPRLVSVPEQQAQPDEAVLDASEAQWLAAQLRNLPDREREVLRQRAAGYSAVESATRLSVSYKSVESAYTRARGRMRMWAGAGSLLVAEYLRRLRLRQRPAAILVSLAAVSAGCLVLTTLTPHSENHDGVGGVRGATTPQALWDSAASAAHAQLAAAVPPLGATVAAPPSSSRAARRPPSSSGATSHQIAQAQVPLHPKDPLTVTTTGSQSNQDFVSFTVACLESQPQPFFQEGTVGCPPQ